MNTHYELSPYLNLNMVSSYSWSEVDLITKIHDKPAQEDENYSEGIYSFKSKQVENSLHKISDKAFEIQREENSHSFNALFSSPQKVDQEYKKAKANLDHLLSRESVTFFEFTEKKDPHVTSNIETLEIEQEVISQKENSPIEKNQQNAWDALDGNFLVSDMIREQAGGEIENKRVEKKELTPLSKKELAKESALITPPPSKKYVIAESDGWETVDLMNLLSAAKEPPKTLKKFKEEKKRPEHEIKKRKDHPFYSQQKASFVYKKEIRKYKEKKETKETSDCKIYSFSISLKEKTIQNASKLMTFRFSQGEITWNEETKKLYKNIKMFGWDQTKDNIKVVFFNPHNLYVTLDNRRLYCLQNIIKKYQSHLCGSLCSTRQISCQEMLEKTFSKKIWNEYSYKEKISTDGLWTQYNYSISKFDYKNYSYLCKYNPYRPTKVSIKFDIQEETMGAIIYYRLRFDYIKNCDSKTDAAKREEQVNVISQAIEKYFYGLPHVKKRS